MRPAWATRGDPNVLSARDPGAMAAIQNHAQSYGLTILETDIVQDGGINVVFARCEPAGTPHPVPAIPAIAKSKELGAFLDKAITQIGKPMNKFSELAARSAAMRKSLDERADKLAARFDAFPAMADAAFAPHEALADETERGFKEMEDALRDLAGHNGAPLSDTSPPSGADTEPKPQ